MDETKKDSDTTIIQRSELTAIYQTLKENTIALVELGVAMTRIRNQIDQLIHKGGIRG